MSYAAKYGLEYRYDETGTIVYEIIITELATGRLVKVLQGSHRVFAQLVDELTEEMYPLQTYMRRQEQEE